MAIMKPVAESNVKYRVIKKGHKLNTPIIINEVDVVEVMFDDGTWNRMVKAPVLTVRFEGEEYFAKDKKYDSLSFRRPMEAAPAIAGE